MPKKMGRQAKERTVRTRDSMGSLANVKTLQNTGYFQKISKGESDNFNIPAD